MTFFDHTCMQADVDITKIGAGHCNVDYQIMHSRWNVEITGCLLQFSNFSKPIFRQELETH